MNNTLNFISAFLFKGWRLADGVLSFLLAAGAYIFPYTNDLWIRIVIISFIFLAAFLIKISRQAYEYYVGFLRPLKAEKQITGDGLYVGHTLIVLENPGYLRDNTLLTLYSRSSAANQPVCILRIIKAVKGEKLLAIQLSPAPTQYDISKYFNEDARWEGLYAIPLINFDEFYNSESMIGGSNE